MKAVLVEKKEGVAWVTMNRPETLNSLTDEMCRGLVGALGVCGEDKDVRAVVLTGAGRAFCAGGDLKTLAALRDAREAEEYVRAAGEAVTAVVRLPKPCVAMVKGTAAGAGFNLAIACDFVCASEKAKFTQAFSSIGLISDCGGNFLLPRLCGPLVAKRLMMLPETLTAEAARVLGLVSFVAADDELAEKTAALASRLVKQPPRALAEIKKFQNEAELFESVLRREEKIQAELICGSECKEGVAAFFEKRPPKF